MKTTFAEKELILGCIDGDEAKEKALFKQYYGPMMQICRRYASNSDEAKDLLQEGFIKIFQNLSKFNGLGI
jgi:RNA polymerase sigma-70 factor (ECF subfamily)